MSHGIMKMSGLFLVSLVVADSGCASTRSSGLVTGGGQSFSPEAVEQVEAYQQESDNDYDPSQDSTMARVTWPGGGTQWMPRAQAWNVYRSLRNEQHRANNPVDPYRVDRFDWYQSRRVYSNRVRAVYRRPYHQHHRHH